MKKVILALAALFITLSAFATVPHKAKIPDIPGYISLKGDFHIHTCFSDASVWPATRVDEADYDGLDFISLTDHMETRHQHMVKDFGANTDRNSSYVVASKAAKKYGILVIHGAELTRGSRIFPGHFNTHFISDCNPIVEAAEANDAKISDEVKREETGIREGLKVARAQNAFVTWNHPDWEMQARNETRWWPIHTELLDAGLFQGIEIYNAYIGYDADAFHWAIEKNLTITTGTDCHKPMFQMVDYEKGAYRPMTVVFAKERSLDGIREAVDNHRTVAVCDGCVYGREELVRQLFDACLKVSNIKYSEKKVSFTITNLSTIPIELVKAPGSENLTYPRQIHINEEEVTGVSINGADSRKPIGMAEFDVHFKVINWLTDADTPLEVSYHFVVPAKYRK
ncbi:MAG: PHP domain-containing protein [Bacteroidales bacterium]|nr:PHP domain-containing protein [Bacteroidales bacterium]